MKPTPYAHTRPPQRPRGSTEPYQAQDWQPDPIPEEAQFYFDQSARLREALNTALTEYLRNQAYESRYYHTVAADETGLPVPFVDDGALENAVARVTKAHGVTMASLAEHLLEPELSQLFYGDEEEGPWESTHVSRASLPLRQPICRRRGVSQ